MPRNVRPSWCELSVDNSANDPQVVKATGPKSRTGSLSAAFSVRAKGSVLVLLHVDMIASRDGDSVLVEVDDARTGRPLFSERFDQ